MACSNGHTKLIKMLLQQYQEEQLFASVREQLFPNEVALISRQPSPLYLASQFSPDAVETLLQYQPERQIRQKVLNRWNLHYDKGLRLPAG